MRFSSSLLAAAAVNTAAALPQAAPSTPQNISIGYYPTWNQSQTANVNFTYYSHIYFAFAIPQQDGSLVFGNESIMNDIVPQLHEQGISAVFSVGGWTGSGNFSDIVADPATSDILVQSITDKIQQYDLDGVDIDWEYPGSGGDTCNVFDAVKDVPNFLTFLNKLRQTLDSTWGAKNKTISLAVPTAPWTGSNTADIQLTDFLDAVDWVDLMLYDINGAWNPVTGPNTPFNYQQGQVAQVSFTSAITNWANAGWPYNKMVAGLALYGRSTRALGDMNQDPNNQYQPQNQTAIQGDQDDLPAFDACANSTAVSGIWRYDNIRAQGVLIDPLTAQAPWTRHWDSITQTPWLFNNETNVYLTYDDILSIGIKVNYAKEKGLLGVMQWTADMDYNNELSDVIHNSLQ